MFLEKHASLLQFDLSMRGDTVVGANLRCRLDPILPVRFRRAFQQMLQRAQRGKILGWMAAWRGHYLVAVDGTGTFSSQRVHGPCCLRARHRNGTTTHSH